MDTVRHVVLNVSIHCWWLNSRTIEFSHGNFIPLWYILRYDIILVSAYRVLCNRNYLPVFWDSGHSGHIMVDIFVFVFLCLTYFRYDLKYRSRENNLAITAILSVVTLFFSQQIQKMFRILDFCLFLPTLKKRSLCACYTENWIWTACHGIKLHCTSTFVSDWVPLI